MVIFCTKEAGKTISFNSPTERDYLNSRARKAFLVPKHEVLDKHFAAREEGVMEILRKNETDAFEGWQQQSALGHWAVMRGVLPPAIWEQW